MGRTALHGDGRAAPLRRQQALGRIQAYDVGIEHGANFLRVQVKSTTHRSGGGYRCMFRPRHRVTQTYTLNQLDLFAAYVIPEDAWYLIPATLLVGGDHISDIMLCPIGTPVKKASYCYECYREAWKLLTKSRSELAQRRAEYRLNLRSPSSCFSHGSRAALIRKVTALIGLNDIYF